MSDFLFSEEPEGHSDQNDNRTPWHILVVDDEPSVHDITRLALSRLEVFDQPVELHSAYSGAQARELLQSSPVDFCMAFIDVVMETQHSGLELVDWIRNELQNTAIRLILRTGQAGTAPESEVIRRYDINDYRAKTDLTAQSLATCVFNAVRGYRDITTISHNLNAFRKLIDTSANLLKEDNLNTLASTALNGLLDILNLEHSALYITRRQQSFLSDTDEKVITCRGRLSESEETSFDQLPQAVRDLIEKAYATGTTQLTETEFAGYFSTSRDSGSVFYVAFEKDSDLFRTNIVEVFATQAVLIFENLSRQLQLENSQKELMYIVGDAVEARSLETGSHVKRVALFCEFFAQKLNQSDAYISALKIAAPLHDIGKIAIPESILHKPGRLTEPEWEIMKTHAAAGGTILERSNLPIARLGARLARWHHENWDGSGYPDGLKGEDIPLEARIMAIADVFDALGAKRSYKKAWPDDQIIALIKEERGKKFDPALVDLLLQHFDELVELRQQFPDG
ncbi:HD domain-containing phosphohydrolase [Reinekea blandensis]|uniref:Response regulator, putative n=1 Tax=Reinekea blandensis MED297 TaxID=314283 RepID=A4BGC8_9GAMM|nr:HD domain-containing phosphohydrolase [Reinekea blandensis]EAR08923.1 response regulator, putative [Reinekea sp. MED297] [Reinekea blandensis MED297]